MTPATPTHSPPFLKKLWRARIESYDNFGEAVSKATTTSKDAFCSIFLDLQDLHSFAPLQSQKFRKCSSKRLMIFILLV